MTKTLEAYFAELLPDKDVRRACLELLRDHIMIAHAISPKSWNVYLEKGTDKPVFIVNKLYIFRIHADLVAKSNENIMVFVLIGSLTSGERGKLEALGCSFGIGQPSMEKKYEVVFIPTTQKENFFSAIEIIRPRVLEFMQKLVKPTAGASFKNIYRPDIIEYMREFLKKDVPDPEYFKSSTPTIQNLDPKETSMKIIQNYLSSKGFSFTADQIAQFFTGLQTKGFVILSGISGTGKTKLGQHFAGLLLPPEVDSSKVNSNLLFLSVRPDWRDSKGLLGYYNPLMKKYEWTPFLRFLVKVVDDYRTNGKQSRPWFVILDEMNLARVEYYFADLLSVLESGRDEQGWTNEPIRLVVPPDVDADRPPEEMKLPPNLYIVGTVNVDETTHAFSPKVLDRAFTIELTDADFSTYPSLNPVAAPVTEKDRQAVQDSFTRGGDFVHVDKDDIADWVNMSPIYRNRLQQLNHLLRPFDMHFGFRVFDEIITFMIAAGENGLFEALGGMEGAFDSAVLMKVLPKFHGSRGKLEIPLLSILAWCQNPDVPNLAGMQEAVRQADNDPGLAVLRTIPYQYSRTAGRVHRMVVSLYSTGFTAFG